MIEFDSKNTRITRRDIAQYERALIEEWSEHGNRNRAERLLQEIPYPDRKPAYGPFRIDADRNLWVAEYLPRLAEFKPVDKETIHWDVFNEAGTAIASIEMPAGFTPYHIGADFVLGKWVDEMEVEYIRKYGLIKG